MQLAELGEALGVLGGDPARGSGCRGGGPPRRPADLRRSTAAAALPVCARGACRRRRHRLRLRLRGARGDVETVASLSPHSASGNSRPSAIMISAAAATTRGPPTCGATARSTPTMSSGLTLECHADLPRAVRRRSIEGDQRSDLCKRERPRVKAGVRAAGLAQSDRLLQELHVACGDSRQRLVCIRTNSSHGASLSLQVQR